MFDVKIREACIRDVRSIKELSEQLGYFVTHEETRSYLNDLRQDNQHVIYVAEMNNEVVGWVHVSLYKTLVSEKRANISGLVVDRNSQRRGVGKELMRSAEEWAKNWGCHGVILRSNVIRQEAHLFYKGIGYGQTKSQYVFIKNFKP
ncbi:GNAT family N-acetyltransferase [Desulfosporosinus sp. OT]|uniref:GNAT family N-acetyltransferase n=1 Tax=Desulfosporosinus sp. OT TaxID=913865 RepID=UPI000300660A|nr:GNAT family N-acetyltransferase [Desulfosporosinus sp. OT]